MKKIVFLILIPIVTCFEVKAQDTISTTANNILYGLVIDGDTILVSTIDEIYVTPKRKFKSRRQMRRYNRLVRNVKKVYPYAKLAKEKYYWLEDQLATIDTERERRVYMKQVEEEMKEEFEGELKKLTISQGRILIKLIDREVGESSYVVLQEFRGNMSAFFWQTLARVFGNDLKNTFDAEGEDKMLNEIVVQIENGML